MTQNQSVHVLTLLVKFRIFWNTLVFDNLNPISISLDARSNSVSENKQ